MKPTTRRLAVLVLIALGALVTFLYLSRPDAAPLADSAPADATSPASSPGPSASRGGWEDSPAPVPDPSAVEVKEGPEVSPDSSTEPPLGLAPTTTSPRESAPPAVTHPSAAPRASAHPSVPPTSESAAGGPTAGWACESTDVEGKASRAEAEAVEGPAVFIPDLCVVTPYRAAGWHQTTLDTDHDGALDKTLDTFVAPMAAWYNETMPVGSDYGPSLVSAHRGAPGGRTAPAGHWQEAQVGQVIRVRDEQGRVFVYEVVRTDRYDHGAVAAQDRLFVLEGEPTLLLVTCHGDGAGAVGNESWAEENFVVTATLVR